MNSVLLILHRAQSSAGRIRSQLGARGLGLDVRRPSLGEPLPQTLEGYRGVVIFGGPMSANDDLEFVRAEIRFIEQVLKAGTPFLGICLGAQMLARQLGASVERHPRGFVEIGFHTIEPTAEGQPYLTRPLHVYQWHREGFALPAGATLLARGAVFENQFFRYGPNAFGVQFHPEVDLEIMRRWLSESRHECSGRTAGPGAHSPLRQHLSRALHGLALARWLESFLGQWLEESQIVPARPRSGAGAPAANMPL